MKDLIDDKIKKAIEAYAKINKRNVITFTSGSSK